MRAIGMLMFVIVMTCGAQQKLANLDFESGNAGTVPPGWFVPDVIGEMGYHAVLTQDGCRNGSCVVMTVPEIRPPRSFGNLMRFVDATPYRGKQVVYRAAVRAAPGKDNGHIALWLRVDLVNGSQGYFDNMDARPIR